MQQLKQYILAVFMIAVGATYCAAQATDTIELSVFNTGVKYRLVVATFGKPQTGAELLTDMVLVHDTIMSYVATGSNGTTFLPATLLAKMPDSLRRAFQAQKLMKPVITTRCDKPITANVKDKVVLMTLGTCDPSVMCLNAQNAGAKAVVLIHPSNNLDSILLKKGPGRDELKITCYTVTRATGTKIAALLPSHVGIKRRIVTPNQNLVAQTNNGLATTEAKETAKMTENEGDTEGSFSSMLSDVRSTDATTKGSTKVKFGISPNPSHDQTTITYQFSKVVDAIIEVKTASGQVVLSRQLKGVTVGSLDISTSEWASGTYILSLQYGKEIKTKQFVVTH
jgi:Secretion system C-terminal sorting domain